MHFHSARSNAITDNERANLPNGTIRRRSQMGGHMVRQNVQLPPLRQTQDSKRHESHGGNPTVSERRDWPQPQSGTVTTRSRTPQTRTAEIRHRNSHDALEPPHQMAPLPPNHSYNFDLSPEDTLWLLGTKNHPLDSAAQSASHRTLARLRPQPRRYKVAELELHHTHR